ncbi:hypothetical protein [Melittangium boletus]|uniref:hypothetical protein n=1 Tax=Melittangium boletus TaxID=83453 RepID=UPI003DA4691A
MPPPATPPSEQAEPGRTQWARSLGARQGLTVLADPEGRSFAVLAAKAEASRFDGQAVQGDLVLARYDAAGQLLDAKGMTAPQAGDGWLAPSPDGYYLLVEQTAAADLGCGPIAATGSDAASLVARLSSAGECRWAKRSGHLRELASSTEGGLWLQDSSSILQYDAAGTLRGAQHTTALVGGRGSIDLHSMVQLNDGSLVFGGTSNGDMRLAGHAWSGQGVPVLFQMRADGQVVWARPFPGLSGAILTVQATPAGTLLALANFTQAFSWAGAEVTPGGRTLLAFEATGTERWARPLDLRIGFNDFSRMAVDAAGAVVVMAQSLEVCNGLGLRVSKFDAAGAPLWQRSFEPEDCQGEMRGFSLTLLSSREIVVTGGYRGKVDTGARVLDRPTGEGFEAFLLKLAP